MMPFKLDKASLKQLSQGAAFCGTPVGGAGSVDMLGTPALGEILPLTLVVGTLVGAGVWMFRRWGKSPTAPTLPTEPSPETATGSEQEERELVNA